MKTKMKIYTITILATLLLCFIAYLERGYFTIGGEWIIAMSIAFLASVIEINTEKRGNYHE